MRRAEMLWPEELRISVLGRRDRGGRMTTAEVAQGRTMLPHSRPDFPKMLNGLRPLVRGRVTAEMVVAAVANRLVSGVYPLLHKLPGATSKLTKAIPVVTFADWLSVMDCTHLGFWLSSAYSHLVHEKVRRKRAMFFTPPALGARMLDSLAASGLNWSTAKIADIACGGAAFLAPAAVRVAEARSACGDDAEHVLRHVRCHVEGIEIDPFLARLSQLFIGMHLYQWVRAAGHPMTVPVTVGDAIRHAPALEGSFDAVICNPPYRKLTQAEVRRLPASLRELCYFQPNLYAMFMALSVRLLNAGGIAGLLTPTSFLSGRSFLKLRGFLGSRCHLKRIELVEKKEGVFLGVEQDTAISIACTTGQEPRRTEVFVGVSSTHWRRVGNVMLERSGSLWVLPRAVGDLKLLRAVPGRTIADYGYAPAVGDVMLYRDRRRRFDSIAAARKAKVVHAVPMLRATEIRADGTLVFESDRRPDCYIEASASGQGVVRRPAVAVQRVTSSDQSRRLNCAPVPRDLQLEHDGVIGENHVTFLVARSSPAVSPEMLARIMSSKPVDRLFRCRSGANNVSVYELSHLPLPDPDVVQKALDRGAGIDDAVRAGYGIASSRTNKSSHGASTLVR